MLDLAEVTAVVVVPDDGPAYLLVSTSADEVRLVPGEPGPTLAALWMLADSADNLGQQLQGRA